MIYSIVKYLVLWLPYYLQYLLGSLYPLNVLFGTRHGLFCRIYFVPAMGVFRYGRSYGENTLAMITPDGEVAYTHEKTELVPDRF
jgi:hypothetical protein